MKRPAASQRKPGAKKTQKKVIAKRTRGARTFGFVAPIGSICLAARFLDLEGLRTCKLPFDWIYSSAYLVRHALRDNFKTFLDRKKYFKLEGSKCQGEEKGQHRSGTGHQHYSKMLPGNQPRSAVFPHHQMWPGAKSEACASFRRAVQRFRTILDHKEQRTLFLFTHTVRTQGALEAIRQSQVDEAGLRPSDVLPVPKGPSEELASLGQVIELFHDLQRRVKGTFDLVAVYLVLPPVSEAGLKTKTQLLMQKQMGQSKLVVHELHCVAKNTGLYFKHPTDARVYRRLVRDGRNFNLVELDDAEPHGYTDSIAKAAKDKVAQAAPFQGPGKSQARKVLGKRRKDAAGRKSRALTKEDWAKTKISVKKENPKKPTSLAFKRYEKYKAARTIGEFFRLGAQGDDFRWDKKNGFLKVL